MQSENSFWHGSTGQILRWVLLVPGAICASLLSMVIARFLVKLTLTYIAMLEASSIFVMIASEIVAFNCSLLIMFSAAFYIAPSLKKQTMTGVLIFQIILITFSMYSTIFVDNEYYSLIPLIIGLVVSIKSYQSVLNDIKKT